MQYEVKRQINDQVLPQSHVLNEENTQLTQAYQNVLYI